MTTSIPPHRRSHRSRRAWLLVGTTVVAACLAAAPVTAAPGTPVSGTRHVTFQQASPAPDVIPLQPLDGLTSLEADVTITADGTVDGKPTAGDLTAQLTSNEQGSRIVARGSLLGDIVAQVGGSAVKLFRPKSVSVYQVPEGTHAVVSGLFDVCVKPQDSQATEALQQLSPQTLMTTLTSSDVARGTFVGDETLDGMAVKHYVIDGERFLAAAKESIDPSLQAFADAVTSAADADLFVSADGGYPVAYRGSFSGAFAPLSFEGDLTIDIRLTGIDGATEVTLPGSCDHPIAQ